jgi:RNA polymerase sigma-70 factor (ECF subfamily)
MDPSDEVLVHRVKEGDRDAFGTLHARYVTALTRHIHGIVRDEAAADDLCQETYLRVWDQVG